MKKTFVSALALCLISTAASADGPYDWTGVTGGIAYGDTSADNRIRSAITGATQSTSVWNSDPHTSAYVGVNYQHGRYVGGIEFLVSNWSGELASNPANTASDTIEIRARLGVAFDRIHVYGTAGHAEVFEEYIGDSGTASGHVYGLGAEYAFGENIIVGAEYVTRDMEQLFGAPFNQISDHDHEEFRFRVGFRF